MHTFNPFRFEGRIGRLQYFGFAVIWCLILFFVLLGIGAFESASGPSATGALAYLLLMLVYAVGTVSYGVRRLHDFDKSGWWYLLLFVPVANAVMALVLLFAPGTPGTNRYGDRDDPAVASRLA